MQAYRYRERGGQTFAGLWPTDDETTLGEVYLVSKIFSDLLENSLAPPDNIIAGATLAGTTNQYRYELFRIWDVSKSCLVYVMLNPSVADACIDDATVRVCIGRAARLDYGSIRIINLFAYRTPSPKFMFDMALQYGTTYVVGLDNDDIIKRVLAREDTKTIVCAWGNDGKLGNRAQIVAKMIKDAGHKPMVIGLTAKGNPKHPLRLSYDLPLLEWV